MLSEPKRTGVSTNQKESAEWAAAMESRIVESGLTSRAAKAHPSSMGDTRIGSNRSPRKKVPMVVERPEERYAESTVSHGVQ